MAYKFHCVKLQLEAVVAIRDAFIYYFNCINDISYNFYLCYAVQQVFYRVAQVLGEQCHSIMTKVNDMLV